MRHEWGMAVCNRAEADAEFQEWATSRAKWILESPLNAVEYLAVSRHHPVADLVVGIDAVGPSDLLEGFVDASDLLPTTDASEEPALDSLDAIAGALAEADEAWAAGIRPWLATIQRLAGRLGRFVNTWEEEEGEYGDVVLPAGALGPPFTWPRLLGAPDTCAYPPWTGGEFPSKWLAEASLSRYHHWHDAVRPVFPKLAGIGDKRPVEVENSFKCLMALGDAAAVNTAIVSNPRHLEAIERIQDEVTSCLHWHALPLSRLGVAGRPNSMGMLEALARDSDALAAVFKEGQSLAAHVEDDQALSEGWTLLRDASLAFALADFSGVHLAVQDSPPAESPFLRQERRRRNRTRVVEMVGP